MNEQKNELKQKQLLKNQIDQKNEQKVEMKQKLQQPYLLLKHVLARKNQNNLAQYVLRKKNLAPRMKNLSKLMMIEFEVLKKNNLSRKAKNLLN
ncbi:hypothetical protein II941_04665 [bacterium]|nr:hypothetical protein [bacterium]